MSVRRAVAMLAALLAVLFSAGAVQASSPQAGTTTRAVRSAPPTAEAAPLAAQASCTARNVSHYDAYTGRTWTRDWVCGNRAGAPLYGCASFISACSAIGWIDTSTSWFVCWGRGAAHSGGNNIWYYTMGDRIAPGRERNHGWGFIPAADVWTSTDPWPGMTECNIP
ncbi:hypothetical protein [Streptomyces zaomyceticus]|uniref:hypothetical protein n=1 Tax=Streptomyces zaomyceticus TaxID=68286 RepID=UPI0016791322|nr:hypothetical protein [Streptomyces zaomyceticus]